MFKNYQRPKYSWIIFCDYNKNDSIIIAQQIFQPVFPHQSDEMISSILRVKSYKKIKIRNTNVEGV